MPGRAAFPREATFKRRSVAFRVRIGYRFSETFLPLPFGLLLLLGFPPFARPPFAAALRSSSAALSPFASLSRPSAPLAA